MFRTQWDPTCIIAPDDCLLCEKPHSTPLCRHCLDQLERVPAGCQTCRNPEVSPKSWQCGWCSRLSFQPHDLASGLMLRNQTRSIFHLAKFQGYWTLLDILSQHALRRFFQLRYLDYDGLAYVPSSFFKNLKRPVNPAYSVAAFLQRKTALPLYHVLCHRWSRNTQIGLDYQQRRRNARHRFKVRARVALPRALILVDDVLTTGATMTACSQLLEKAGVAKIAWFSLLRAV